MRHREEEKSEPALAELDLFPRAFVAKEFLDRIGGDRDLFVELLDTFSTDAKRQVRSLREAADSGDLEKAAAQAHQLKGSAATVSARELALLAAECEELGVKGAASELRETCEQLPGALTRFGAAIDSVLPR